MSDSVQLANVAHINPRGPARGELHADEVCDFVPMAGVHEDGTMEVLEQRPYHKVAKGYTPFRSGDVLLAKITPCFENGKISLAQTSTKYAFGSTELHVIRPINGDLDSRYLYYFLRQDRIRTDGENQMTGSAGQKRVPRGFLDQLKIPLPEIEEQRRIAAILDKADGIRRKREQALAMADNAVRSAFLQKFGHPLDPNSKLKRSELGIFCDFFAGNSLPKGEEFVGQDDGLFLVKVSDLNSPGNEVSIRSAKLWAPDKASVKGGVFAPHGAVVFPKRGGAIATNKKRVLERDSVLDPNLMAVAPKADSPISNHYLRTWFELIDLQTISSGSSVPQLNKKDLAPLAFGVPSRGDIEWFNGVFSFSNELKSRLRSALNEAEELFSSLSARSFRGEL